MKREERGMYGLKEQDTDNLEKDHRACMFRCTCVHSKKALFRLSLTEQVTSRLKSISDTVSRNE